MRESLSTPLQTSETGAPVARVKALLLLDLVDSTGLLERLGDTRAQALFAAVDQLARSLLQSFEGREIDKTDGFLLLFERPIQAVGYALACHQALAELGERYGVQLQARMGIHLGEVLLRENSPREVEKGAKPLEAEGLAKHIAARVASLARGRQTLLTQAAFDLARRASIGELTTAERTRWLAHGPYLFQGIQEPLDIFEVGLAGAAPLSAPADTPKARRAVAAGEEVTLGWRPAAGLEVPWRHYWILERKLGDGGFGEVWLAHHEKTGDQRVFKFCYEAERLRALKREVTLFHILRDTLGERSEIARILDWNFKEAPFFIEVEYIGKDLLVWAEEQGGIAQVPLPVRLEIVAQIATALAAAHSVGVLHKDVKPSNILISAEADGRTRARLTDFGIGLVTDPSRLPAQGVTWIGMTEIAADSSSSGAGTRLYMAPELLEGKVSSMQSDLYALGVVLYQMLVGDLTRALAPGWEREIDDGLLIEDLASLVDGDPDKRPRSALEVADCLRQLEPRREARAAALRAAREAEETRLALLHSRRRRRLLATFTALVLVFAIAMGLQMRRTSKEASRANREAEVSRHISDFLVGLFEVSDPNSSDGNTVTARELLDRGTERIRSELHDQPETRASLLASMASAYAKLGLYEPAATLQREALTLRRNTLGNENLPVAESLADLGETLSLLGRFAEAEPLLRESLGLRRKLLGRQGPVVVETMYRLANLQLQTGRYAEAESLYREALKAQTVSGRHDEGARGQIFASLAVLYERQGKTQGVEELYDQALPLMEQGFGKEHTWIAIVLGNKGRWLMRQRRYDEAEACYARALAIMRQRYGPAHPHVAYELYQIADLANARGEHSRAEALTRESLGILTKRLPAGHWRIALANVILGTALTGQGRYTEAAALLVPSYPILRDRLGPAASQTQQALGALVDFYTASGQPQEADRYRALSASAAPGGGL